MVPGTRALIGAPRDKLPSDQLASRRRYLHVMRHTARLAGPLAAGALGAMSIRGAPQCEAGEKDNEKRLDEKTCAGRRAALAARWVEE